MTNLCYLQISVAARTDVPNSFGPELPKSKLVKKEFLRDFLLTKLLNAEYSCHNAPQFKDKMVSEPSFDCPFDRIVENVGKN